jgi:hypothetical protein
MRVTLDPLRQGRSVRIDACEFNSPELLDEFINQVLVAKELVWPTEMEDEEPEGDCEHDDDCSDKKAKRSH